MRIVSSLLQHPCLLILIGVLFQLSGSVRAQSPERGLVMSKYYSPKDYNAGTQNWAIAQDDRGVMYFGNTMGVLIFDGNHWELLVQEVSTVRSLSVDNKGVVYIGGYNELGCLKPDRQGRMQYYSLTDSVDEEYQDFGEIWDILSISDTTYFLTDSLLFRYHNNSFSYWKSEADGFYLNHAISGRHFVQELGKGLMIFDDDSLKLVNGGEYFSNISIRKIFGYDDGLLLCSRNHGLFLYNDRSDTPIIKRLDEVSEAGAKLNTYFIEHSFYHGTEVGGNRLALGSITGEVLVVNSNFEVVDILNHESIGSKSRANYLYFQDNQQLWLALDNGISMVEILSPYRYWGEDNGFKGVLTDVARLRDTLFVSTTSGVLYTTTPEEEKFQLNSFKPVPGKYEQAWHFLYFNPYSANELPEKNKKLLVAATAGVFVVEKGRGVNVSDYESISRLHQSKKDPSMLFVGYSGGIAALSFKSNKWTDHGQMFGISHQISEIAEDEQGNLWLGANHIGVYRIENPLSQHRDSVKINLFNDKHGLASFKTISIFDTYEPIAFNIDGTIYAFNEKQNRFQQKDVSEFVSKVDSIDDENQEPDTLSLFRVQDDVITNAYITHPNDTILWFATNNGLFRYKGRAPRQYHDIPPAIISRVVSGDSVLFYGTNIALEENVLEGKKGFLLNSSPVVDLKTILDFKHNSLTFHYALPYFEGSIKNQFSYYLEGYEDDWSDWSSEAKKEYTNLYEGKYIFKVKAKNIYGIESDVAEYHFTILPPWYRTYLAYAAYILIAILFIVLVVILYTRRLVKEKEKLEILVVERTQEILMQKEEILVQSEHLKEANEWIKAKNIELESQKNEIEIKKNQLEVSNATKNKFFRIIAHDLRNPISTLVNTTGYILTDIDSIDRKTTKQFIENLNSLSLKTYNLLENLLDWSSAQMGGFEYKPKSLVLKSLVMQNVELISGDLDQKNINVSIDIPDDLKVRADENMLLTIIRNLLSNAVKFTFDNGTIKIYTQISEGVCKLSISDNGVGISEENLEKLFKVDKDVRTYGTRNEKGSGIGLLLCKEFAELNGGTIVVESKPNEGSTFAITLMLA